MKNIVLILFFISFCNIEANAQYTIGTYSFSNNGGMSGGGTGNRNQWTNTFNWVVWNGSAFVSSGVAPSSGNDVIINTDNIITAGPIISGVNSADRLVIDGDVSCKSFSIEGTSVGKGIIFPSGSKLNVYGDFDLSGSSFKFNIDGVSKSGYALNGTINFTGTNNYIKTSGNNMALNLVQITGVYQLLGNYNQTGIDINSTNNNLYLDISNKLTTNGYSIRTSQLYCHNNGTLNMSNSKINVGSFYFDYTQVPTTAGNENIYISDTIAFTSNNFVKYHLYGCTGSYTVNSVNFYFSKESSKTGSEFNSPLTCKKIRTNGYLKAGYSTINAIIADTLEITDAGSILLESGANLYTFNKIIVPSVCDKNVLFSSQNYNPTQSEIKTNIVNTVSNTSWLGIKIVGVGSIIANNSINLNNNSGNLVINPPSSSRILAWCGSMDSNWNNSANWRLASISGCGVCPPTNIDSVIFDPIYLSGSSIQTITINNPSYCKGISFLYPTSNPISISGGGMLFNASGLWIGYTSGVANTSLKGTDWSGFTGYLNFLSTKKNNIIATQNVPMNNFGLKLFEAGVLFNGGGEWLFNDDFTAQKTLMSLINGHLKLNGKTISINAISNADAYNKPSVLDYGSSIVNILGPAGGVFVSNQFGKTFVNGGTSTIKYTPIINGYNSGSGNIALSISLQGVDTLGNNCIRFNNFEINDGLYSSNKTIGITSNSLTNYFIRKLTINSPTKVQFYSYNNNLNNLLEIDSLDLSSGNKLILPSTNNPSSLAYASTTVSIKVNQAIVTNTSCGAAFGNIDSDSPTLAANINIPSDFGASKLIVNNVTINGGLGTLTANNSVFTGIYTGWSSTPVLGNKFYWNGEGSNNHWTNYRNWNYNTPPSPTSTDDLGNNPGQCIPGPLDSVFFVNNAFPNTLHSVLMNGNISVKTIKWSLTDQLANSITWADTSGSSLTLYESLHLNDRVLTTFTNNLTFLGTTQLDSVRSAGRNLKARVIYFKGTGKYTLADDFLADCALYFLSGHFDTWNHKLDVYNFYSYSTISTRTLNISNSVVNVNRASLGWDYIGGSGLWHYNSNNSVLFANGSVINVNAGNIAAPLGVTLGHASMHSSGSIPVQYNKIVFSGIGGGNFYSDIDNSVSINKLIFNSPSSGIFGSNKIDTLIYSPMSTNYLESGKTQSIDSLFAISNNCQPITIKAYTNGSYAYLCDVGSFKKLKTIFGDIIDVKSDACSGFIPSYESVNGSITNSPGWVSTAASLTFGFPIKSYTTTCKDGRLLLTNNGFYPGIGSTYLWSNGSTNDSIYVNDSKTYSLTVTYKPGCSITDTVKVLKNNNLAATYSVTPLSCSGYSNGIISFIPNLDTAFSHVYQYIFSSLSSSIISTYSTVSGTNYNSLTSGIYTITVKDTTTNSLICSFSQTVNVTSPNVLLPNVNVSNTVSCFGASTGIISSTPTGGNGGYQYLWTNGSSTFTTQNINSVPAGNYTLTLLDSKSCQTSTVVSLNEPASALTSSLGTLSNVKCFGGTTTISISASGGTGATSYSWIPSGGSANTATITSGSYTVFVSDANNCSTSQTLSITQPTQAISLSSLANNTIACNGGTTNVLATINGGTSPYTFSWGSNSSNTSSANYSAGNYSITVLDANSCSITPQTFTVTEPQALNLQINSLTNISCSTPTASVSYTSSGGTLSYTYSFVTQNGTIPTFTTTATTVNNLTADNYSVTLIDANGCVTYTTFVVSNNSNPPTVSSVTQSVSCFGGNDGAATASVTSMSSYSYLWNNGSTNSGITNLPSGIYTLTVTDVNNCKTSHTLSITQPNDIVISELVNSPSCDNAATGIVSINILGGTPTYSVLWSNGTTGVTANKLPTGTITTTITDSHNCKQTYSTFVSEVMCIETLIPELISPNGDGKNEPFMINSISYFPNNKLEIFNRWGSLVYSKEKYDNTFNGKANVSNSSGSGLLPAGTYFVVFDFGDGKTEPYHGFLEIKY